MLSFLGSAVAFRIGGLAVHWYGLLYIGSWLLALWLAPRLQNRRGLALRTIDWFEIILWSAAGVLLGGRLGYVLFYEPIYFFAHPLEIGMLANGGMSAHGGFIGVGMALWLWSRRRNINFWLLADVAVVPAALGLTLGRLGNFINGELYGTVTTMPWAITSPTVEESRHPIALYAMGKDILLASFCWLHLQHTRRSGTTTALFLVVYGAIRFLLEFVRVSNVPAWAGLTRGQILSATLVLAGIGIWWSRLRTPGAIVLRPDAGIPLTR